MGKDFIRLRAAAAALVVMAAASGCATENPAGQGWHPAVITRLGNALPARGSGIADCRPAAPDAAAPQRGYAEVAYREGGERSRLRIALMPDGARYVVGEEVYVNVRDCAVALSLTAP